jgi:hypothetical protein
MSEDKNKVKAINQGMDRKFADEVSVVVGNLRRFCFERQIFFACAFMSKDGETITSGGGTYESGLILVQALMDAMEERAEKAGPDKTKPDKNKKGKP